MLDKLPVWARYFFATVVVPVLSFLVTKVGSAVVSQGAGNIDWGTFTPVTLNDASKVLAAGLVAYAAYYFTPITNKFGVGAIPATAFIDAPNDSGFVADTTVTQEAPATTETTGIVYSIPQGQ